MCFSGRDSVRLVALLSLECCEVKISAPAFSEDAPHHSSATPIISFCQRSCFIDSTFFCPIQVQESVDHYEMSVGNVSNVLGVSQVIDFRYFKRLVIEHVE